MKFNLHIPLRAGLSGTKDNLEPDLIFEKNQNPHDKYCIDFTWSKEPEEAFNKKVKKYKDVFRDLKTLDGESRVIPIVVDIYGRVYEKSKELIKKHLQLDDKFIEYTALYQTIHWLALATKAN